MKEGLLERKIHVVRESVLERDAVEESLGERDAEMQHAMMSHFSITWRPCAQVTKQPINSAHVTA